MTMFDDYAFFYDSLYKDKDYKAESDYIGRLLNRYAGNFNTLLDMGCGTGIHAVQLVMAGYQVCGIDISDKMLAQAQARMQQLSATEKEKLRFQKGDVRSARLGQQYDVVISLFHVASYQTSNDDLSGFFHTANTHLKEGGLLIFDFWYGPGVLTDPPGNRKKSIILNNEEYIRSASSVMNQQDNTVKIHYEINKSGADNVIKETHTMRYLFKPELELFLKQTGFEMLAFHKWLTETDTDLDSWNAVAVARKVQNLT